MDNSVLGIKSLSTFKTFLTQYCLFQAKNMWKFPGGLSNPSENIGK